MNHQITAQVRAAAARVARALPITPAVRFNARDFARAYPVASEVRRAWNQAAQIEGFGHSYTEAAVEAGRRVLLALADHDERQALIGRAELLGLEAQGQLDA